MTERGTTKRLILPLILCSFVAYLLVGCIYIPATRQFMPDGKARPESLIGDAKSKKPIRLDVTSIEDAMSIIDGQLALANTNYMSNWIRRDDGKRYTRQFEIREGYWVWPLCFYAEPNSGVRFLILTVNEKHTVIGYETSSKYQSPTTHLTEPDR